MLLYYKILVFVSIIIFLFPPIRQYKQNYFWFFLILAIADPFFFIIARPLGIATPQSYVFIALLYSLSVLNYSKISCYKVVFIVALILLGVFSFINWEYSYHYLIIVFIIILLVVVKNSILFVSNSGSINIFHIVLFFYLLTSLLKFWNLLVQFDTGVVFFIVTTYLQLLVGIFFSIFAENNPKLLIKIGGKN